jgi:hypothetical protein
VIWLLLAAAQAGPCDLSHANDVQEALTLMAPDQRVALAAAWLAEDCALPPALDKGLADLANVMPEQRPLVAARTTAADPDLLLRACPGGPAAFAEAGQATRQAARVILYDRCQLARHGVVDRAEFLAATGGEPMLLVLVAEALGAQRSEPALRDALRALAGVRMAADPRPVIVPTQVPVGP